jgi:hypothetical protein
MDKKAKAALTDATWGFDALCKDLGIDKRKLEEYVRSRRICPHCDGTRRHHVQ